ncbi:MAG: YdeI/OmpD-associated family protein [Ekhidna sp.]|nr:YdeI/OmpD-associated family protein [Ekhidna sp.]
MEMVKTPEAYFANHPEKSEILQKIRSIFLRTELEEKMNTYCWNNKNIAGIGAFKSYAGIWFFNGALLKDPDKVLINAQEGKTKGMRQWRFESIHDINEKTVLEYIKEAIENQKQGKEIKTKKKPLMVPNELKEALASDTTLSEIFDRMSLSKRREYSEYIRTAKKDETKQKRLKKIIPMILSGIGLNDKYR